MAFRSWELEIGSNGPVCSAIFAETLDSRVSFNCELVSPYSPNPRNVCRAILSIT